MQMESIPFAQNLETYLQWAINRELPQGVCPTISPEGELALLTQKQAKCKRFFLPSKRAYVKKWVAAFLKEYPVPITALRFICSLKNRAYMTDKGELILSSGFLLRSSFPRIIKVLLHELSHLALLGMQGYDKLLFLDAAFLQAFGQEWAHLSPVELYATTLSLPLLQSVICLLEGGQNKWLLEKEWESEMQKCQEGALRLANFAQSNV